MAQYPTEFEAGGLWDLKKVRRSIKDRQWPIIGEWNIDNLVPSNFDGEHMAFGAKAISKSYTTQSFQWAHTDNLSSSRGTLSQDGERIYLVTASGVLQYRLASPFRLSTVARGDLENEATLEYTFTEVPANTNHIAWKTDGTVFYRIATTGRIYAWSCSTAFDLSTADTVTPLATNELMDIASASIDLVRGLSFSPDGVYMYISGNNTSNGETVSQFTLSTAWDVTTASYTRHRTTTILNASTSTPLFTSDGLKMYIGGKNASETWAELEIWELSTPWDISTATYIASPMMNYNSSEETTGVWCGFISPDDTFFTQWLTCESTLSVQHFNLSTVERIASTPSDVTEDIKISEDGTRMYLSSYNSSTGGVYEYALSTPFDPRTAASTHQGYVNIPYCRSFCLSQDGQYLYGGNDSLKYFRQYTLSTPWDLSTATLTTTTGNYSYGSSTTSMYLRSLTISQDGTKLIGSFDYFNRIQVWDLSTPFALSSWSGTTYETYTLNGTQDTAVQFSSDGYYCYELDYAKRLYQYSLTNPFDLSTADTTTYRLKSIFPVAYANSGATHFCLSLDGQYAYHYWNGGVSKYEFARVKKF